MTKSGRYRSLAALALLRLSESDLRTLHAMVSEMSPGTFLELIRDLEDEVNTSMTLALKEATERESFGSTSDQLYYHINQIRRSDLRISVQQFVDLLMDCLSRLSEERGVEVPRFDSRRGLEAWIGKLIRTFSEQDIYHATMQVRSKRIHSQGADWKLR